ncbi:ABC transporter permease [Thermoactinospora rubra]|uniref:ABC transporter permease n=1 Tax=Thermoactinospora rubra TaxID=1088767 RepID=UPI000A0F85B8|nr:ABC transporter permease [Thermoactinospora rubra]
MSEPASGVIHDIGYRHYDGPRLGSWYATRALFVYSLRAAFGFGRTARAKIMPFGLATVMLLPAVVSIAMMALLKERGMPYPGFFVYMQAILSIFVASQSPALVAPDLRHRVLPLYLSRPVGVPQYAGAKLAAMTLAVFLVIGVPLTLVYAGELLIDLEGPPQTGEYLAALTTGLCLALLLSAFGLTIASLTPRRGLGVASVIAVYLLLLAVSGVLVGTFESIGSGTAAAWSYLINPFFLLDAVRVALFGGESASGQYPDGPGPVLLTAALVALGVAALFLRYRKAAAK